MKALRESAYDEDENTFVKIVFMNHLPTEGLTESAYDEDEITFLRLCDTSTGVKIITVYDLQCKFIIKK